MADNFFLVKQQSGLDGKTVHTFGRAWQLFSKSSAGGRVVAWSVQGGAAGGGTKNSLLQEEVTAV